jgi:hypothetical protein
MRIDFHGLIFETPSVFFYLWSPWRATALEHRLFEAVQNLPRTRVEEESDARRIPVTDPKIWQAVMQTIARVLKGWQEEAGTGGDRRTWRWMLEADMDCDGYDHNGEPVSLWAWLRTSIDHGGPTEPEKGEDYDLEGFGIRISGENLAR